MVKHTMEQLQRWLELATETADGHRLSAAYYKERGGNSDIGYQRYKDAYQKNLKWLAQAEQDCASLRAEIAWLEFMECN